MKRKLSIVLAVVLILVTICGCSGETRKGYVYELVTGETYSIAIQTEKGWDFKRDSGHFNVTKDKVVVITGSYCPPSKYEAALKAVDGGSAEKIEKTDNKLVWKDGSKICAVFEGCVYVEGTVSGDVSEDLIKDAIGRMRVEYTAEQRQERLYE